MLIEDLVSFVVGVSTGVAGALLGLGGGFIFVPYFHLFLGLPMQKAAGSSLAAIVFLTSSAASAYRFQGRIDLKLAAMFLVASAPSAFLGAWLAQQIEAYYLKLLFSILLTYAGLHMALSLRFSRRGNLCFGPSWRRKLTDRWGSKFEYNVSPLLAPMGGMAAGLISGMVGVGGGTVTVPVMTLVLGVPIHIAVATVSLTNLVNAASGFSGHLLAGTVNLRAALTVGVGSLLGAQLGSKVCRRLEAGKLRRFIGVVLVLLALRMMLSG